jgi:hypothetical protein
VNLKVAEISAVETPAELWRVARRYYHALGFRALAYFVASRGGTGARGGFNIIHRGWQSEVRNAYIDEGWGERNVFCAAGDRARGSVRWTDVTSQIVPDAEQQAFIDRMRAAELGDGYALPVFGPMGRNGFPRGVGRPLTEQVLDEAPVEEMHMVAQADAYAAAPAAARAGASGKAAVDAGSWKFSTGWRAAKATA